MQEIKKIGTLLTEYQHLFPTIKTSDNKYSFSEETITMPAGGFEKAYFLFYINLPMRFISFFFVIFSSEIIKMTVCISKKSLDSG